MTVLMAPGFWKLGRTGRVTDLHECPGGPYFSLGGCEMVHAGTWDFFYVCLRLSERRTCGSYHFGFFLSYHFPFLGFMMRG